jgi:hypothetical protein
MNDRLRLGKCFIENRTRGGVDPFDLGFRVRNGLIQPRQRRRRRRRRLFL